MKTEVLEVEDRKRLHLDMSVQEYLNVLASVINLAAEQHQTDRNKLADIVLRIRKTIDDPEVKEWVASMADCCPTGKMLAELATAIDLAEVSQKDKEELAAHAEECKAKDKIPSRGERSDIAGLFRKELDKGAKLDKGLGVPSFMIPKAVAKNATPLDTNLHIHCLNDGKRATIQAKMGAREAYAVFASFAYTISAAAGIPYGKITQALSSDDEEVRDKTIEKCTEGLMGGEIMRRWFKALSDMKRVMGEEDKNDAATLKNNLSDLDKE